MAIQFSALFSGLLFGFGLAISGMSDPAKVIGFLDISRNWDPALMFVMGGAVVVSTLGYFVVLKKAKPVFAESFTLPMQTKIDRPLIIGATMFGIGWGLVGYCPGPVFVALAYLQDQVVIFFIAMTVGMLLAKKLT
jgi:uncharacterized membrane protein YedE/YeeE